MAPVATERTNPLSAKAEFSVELPFENTWLMVSHTSRFIKPGDYVSGNYIFDYFIIRDLDGSYQAFHNVCRHRAFPVVTKSTGSTLVYHGWSYNPKGNLIKAPKFDTVSGFDKSANGLFKVHTHVTSQGFIFLNFDASPTPVSFEEHFGQLPNEWRNFNQDNYTYAYSWQALDLNEYRVTPLQNAARHEVPNAKNRATEEAPPTFTFIFPTNGVTVTDTVWYTMRTVPISATKTRMEYDVYRRKTITYEELREFMKFYEQVEKEDYNLCTATQKGLNAGIYSQGPLHPDKENGVIFYQERTVGKHIDFCEKHLAAEKAAGREIYPAQPASQQQDASSGSACSAYDICSQMGNQHGKLAW
ncbi:hypothetical protein EW145_g4448 [Phellinidium pouzarii]|uniref:Choline monooxygenase, chloroplastic n=1 Tax=Phellinidium pouzarii TaxID=167371 RepID=A0A4S4L8D2_9AGAM|nr:hypothetical protein EW145_g4448 [Phellinidium pouzarii]